MSFYVVDSEYDMDTAVSECLKLMPLNKSNVKLAFNNMGMVTIFMDNLSDKCEELGINPDKNEFFMDVLVQPSESDDEEGAL